MKKTNPALNKGSGKSVSSGAAVRKIPDSVRKRIMKEALDMNYEEYDEYLCHIIQAEEEYLKTH